MKRRLIKSRIMFQKLNDNKKKKVRIKEDVGIYAFSTVILRVLFIERERKISPS